MAEHTYYDTHTGELTCIACGTTERLALPCGLRWAAACLKLFARLHADCEARDAGAAE